MVNKIKIFSLSFFSLLLSFLSLLFFIKKREKEKKEEKSNQNTRGKKYASIC